MGPCHTKPGIVCRLTNLRLDSGITTNYNQICWSRLLTCTPPSVCACAPLCAGVGMCESVTISLPLPLSLAPPPPHPHVSACVMYAPLGMHVHRWVDTSCLPLSKTCALSRALVTFGGNFKGRCSFLYVLVYDVTGFFNLSPSDPNASMAPMLTIFLKNCSHSCGLALE